MAGDDPGHSIEGDFIAYELALQQERARDDEFRQALADLRHLSKMAVRSANLDPYLTLDQVADYSQISVRELYRHLADPLDPLPHYRVGKLIRVKVSDVDRWMARRRTLAGADLDQLVRDVAMELEPR